MKKSLFAAAALSLALIPYSASAQQSNPPSDPQSVQQPATTAQPAEANRTPSTPSQANTSDPNANAAPSTNVNREAVGTAGQASAQDPNAAATRQSNEQSLPATGSPIPLMLFGAFSAFAAAGGLRLARR